MQKSWQEKIKDFCEAYNIPIFYLAETMYEPKVTPMIRGKAFEFSTMIALQKLLPKSAWIVDKPIMNAQIGLHDIDVRIVHKPTKKITRVECKLCKKGGYRLFSDGHSEIRVKCMRSRTLGPTKVKELAPKLGVSEKVLSIHNDEYLPRDFDIVISTIGNAFYKTNKKTGHFEWSPTYLEKKFLIQLGASSKNLKDFAFNKMYAARTKDIAVSQHNKVQCTRGKCKNKNSCGFIPNYPIIYFDSKTLKPVNGWVEVEKISSFLSSHVTGKN